MSKENLDDGAIRQKNSHDGGQGGQKTGGSLGGSRSKNDAGSRTAGGKSKSLECDCELIHKDVVEKVSGLMPAREKLMELADLYKNFADSTRANILWALGANEMCVCDLAGLFNMTKSAISHQLKVLRLSNLVKYRKDGKVVYYSLADNHVKSILEQGMEHVDE